MSEYSSAVLSDVPVVYYRLNESADTTATDASGNGYDGTYYGSLTYSQTGAIIDDPDTAILFPGSGGVLSLPLVVNASTWAQYTLEVWIKMTGGYQHVIITYDGTTLTKYLNGSVYTSGSGSDTVLIDQNLTFIGTTANATLDEVALYNSLFTQVQAAWHYSVGTTGRSGMTMLPTAYRRDGEFNATYRRGS